MYSYDGLLQQLAARNLTRSALAESLGISSRTIAKIAKGEKLSDRVLQKMAGYLGCEAAELYRIVSANPVLQRLREERDAKISGGLYHELQVRLTYNSNHMEGSRLSEEQTRSIFETRTIDAQGVPVDDIIETVNHFRAVDYVIEVAELPLREPIIKKLHQLLKQGTADAALSWFAVGEYKRRPNVVGGRDTTPPAEVPARIAALLRRYEALPAVELEDIVALHVAFERIHPFQDGNGRIGRLIALKECLRHHIVPFIIEDCKKAFYYCGLSEWQRDPGHLIGTCQDGQDVVRGLLEKFEVEL